jgi:hypothetical protein
MQPPHYYELIDAVNARENVIKLRVNSSYGLDNQTDPYGWGYRVAINKQPSTYNDAIMYTRRGFQISPENLGSIFILKTIDKRKKKLFKFEDYADIHTLAEDLVKYIEDSVYKYSMYLSIKPQFTSKTVPSFYHSTLSQSILSVSP